jgi:hypothetical protein
MCTRIREEQSKRKAKEQGGANPQATAEALDRDVYRAYYFIEALWLQKPLSDVLTLEQWKQLSIKQKAALSSEVRKWKRVKFPDGRFAYERREE